jgi:L-amino acid N-acyltransferase YncA
MKKAVTLKDRSEVEIRPMTPADFDDVLAFFRELPRQDRGYLRRDVSKQGVVEQLIAEVQAGQATRLVATAGDRIVAEAALELERHGWKQHVGEMRLVVASTYQRKGLGMLLARELYHIAASAKIEQLIVKMMRPQIAARKIFRKLGFHQELLMREYVKDLDGRRQDLIVMRCDLEGLWQELEDYFAQSDWRRAR